jgi:hypothetical protein
VPSRPQLVTPSSGHSLCGSAPTGTLVHVPTLPSTAHDWQSPEQSERQQTPSEQKPLLQSIASVQEPPASISAANCPLAAAPPRPPSPLPLPACPDPLRASPPPPHALTANTIARTDALICEPKTFDMHHPPGIGPSEGDTRRLRRNDHRRWRRFPA